MIVKIIKHTPTQHSCTMHAIELKSISEDERRRGQISTQTVSACSNFIYSQRLFRLFSKIWTQAGIAISIWLHREMNRQTNGQTYKQTTRQRHRHTNGQSNRQTSGQRSKETYRQTMIIHTAVDIDKKYPPIYIYEKQRSPKPYNDQECLCFLMFFKPPCVYLHQVIIPFYPNE